MSAAQIRAAFSVTAVAFGELRAQFVQFAFVDAQLSAREQRGVLIERGRDIRGGFTQG